MTNFAIKITYNECVAKCSRHNPSDFNNTFKTLEEAVACVYQNFNEDFTNAQNNNSIELQPCQLTGSEYCGEQAMLEAFQVNPTLDFGDFYIKIKERDGVLKIHEDKINNQ